MNYCFTPVPQLELTHDIKQQIINLDTQKLVLSDGETYYDIDYQTTLSIVKDRNDYLDYQQYYENTGLATITTWHLPNRLIDQILNHFQNFFIRFAEDPTIRLQAVHGPQLPIHIDRHKNASIIHPLLNHENTWTRFYEHRVQTHDWQQHYSAIKDLSWPSCNSMHDFYQLPDRIQQELLTHRETMHLLLGYNLRRDRKDFCHIVNPTQVTLIEQIEICSAPCLLNTQHCHDVYLPQNPQANAPRLSLYWKFGNTDFQQVISAYKEYVQSKI